MTQAETKPGNTKLDDDLPHQVVTRAAATEADASSGFMRILRHIRFVPLVLITLFLGGVLGLYFQPPGLQFLFRTVGLEPGAGTSTPIAIPVEARETLEAQSVDITINDVVALGRLLPRSDIITVATPFGAGDARVLEVLVEVGDQVEAGQVLAVLDNRDSLEAALSSARAEVALREATLEQTRQSVKASLDEARASLARLQSAQTQAETNLARIQTLSERGIASQATLDEARTSALQAAEQTAQASATLARFNSDEPDQQPDVIVAQRQLEAARAALQRAERDLSNSQAVAPIAGTVLDVLTNVGERPASAGLMTMGDLSVMHAELEVYQTLIGAVSVGDAAQIIAEALPEPLEGTVVRKGLQVERQEVVRDDPAANTDARVVKVIVELNAASTAVARNFTDLDVVGKIQTQEGPSSSSGEGQ